MGVYKITRYEYHFKKPDKLISENEYRVLKKTLPPALENNTIAVFKKYWWFILLIPAFPIFVIFALTGTIDEMISYSEYIKYKNRFIQKYFHLIHTSKNYDEFKEGYKKL